MDLSRIFSYIPWVEKEKRIFWKGYWYLSLGFEVDPHPHHMKVVSMLFIYSNQNLCLKWKLNVVFLYFFRNVNMSRIAFRINWHNLLQHEKICSKSSIKKVVLNQSKVTSKCFWMKLFDVTLLCWQIALQSQH